MMVKPMKTLELHENHETIYKPTTHHSCSYITQHTVPKLLPLTMLSNLIPCCPISSSVFFMGL